MGPDAPILPPVALPGPNSVRRRTLGEREPFQRDRIDPPMPCAVSAGTNGSNTMVRKILTATLIAGTMMLAACNTVAGAGKDVSSAGEAVSDAAK
jgi:predicted small secreted protein